MSRTIVRLMIRTGIPFATWIEQPDGVIETALELLTEDSTDVEASRDGPLMSG